MKVKKEGTLHRTLYKENVCLKKRVLTTVG